MAGSGSGDGHIGKIAWLVITILGYIFAAISYMFDNPAVMWILIFLSTITFIVWLSSLTGDTKTSDTSHRYGGVRTQYAHPLELPPLERGSLGNYASTHDWQAILEAQKNKDGH